MIAAQAARAEHSSGMPSHLATPIRRRRAGALAIALGVGLIGFTLVDEDPRPEVRTSSDGVVPADTSPTVRGAVVTRDSVGTAAPAAPAAPVTFEIDDEDERTTTTRRRPISTSTAKSAPTTFPPPTLGPPWSIVREPEDTTTTTTTVEDTTTSSSTTTTDTTEGTTTTDTTDTGGT